MFTQYCNRLFQEGVQLHKSGLLNEAAYRYISLLEPDVEFISQSENSNWDSDFQIEDKYKLYANLNLATIRFEQFRYDEAIYHYTEGLKLEPSNFSAHVDLAKTYEMTGQWDKAIFHIDESLKIFPNHTTALRRKRRILEEKQFYELLHKKLESEIDNYKPNYAHFIIQADYEIDMTICEIVESLMQRVCLELNEEFNFQLEKPVNVALFYRQSFYNNYTPFPKWAQGMYDGVIKIFLREDDKFDLEMTYILLRHEYTHNIVNRLSNGRCPRWFDEGLSRYKAKSLFNFERSILQKMIEKEQQFTLKQLESQFINPKKNKMRLVYIQAHSLAEFLFEKLGTKGVLKLLKKFGNSRDNSNEIIFEFLGITPEQMQKEWLERKSGEWVKG